MVFFYFYSKKRPPFGKRLPWRDLSGYDGFEENGTLCFAMERKGSKMVDTNERTVLRGLARQVDELGRLPVMERRRELWRAHNDLERVRPLIAVFPEGSWNELLPEESLVCKNEEARSIERDLRSRLYYHTGICDDAVIERTFKVRKLIDGLPGGTIDLWVDWGVPLRRTESSASKGAYGFDPVIHTMEDVKKIRTPVLRYREKETLEQLERMQDLLGDILDVRLCGVDYVAFHIMYYYTHMRGLEQMLYDLYDEPELFHAIVDRLEQGYHSIVDQCEELGLFERNDNGTYQSTGGFGYTSTLIPPDFDPAHVRPSDLWACAEAQEMAPVSPDQTEEFCMQAERRLLRRFGRNGYACCEPVQDKLPYIRQIHALRRISVSPFADIEACARQLKDEYIFSWKCSPFLVCGPVFDEDEIRAYFRKYLPVLKEHGCHVEMILADTHTCHGEPERFLRWTALAREAIAEVYGCKAD